MKPPSRGALPAALSIGPVKLRELARERRGARHAGRGERFERRRAPSHRRPAASRRQAPARTARRARPRARSATATKASRPARSAPAVDGDALLGGLRGLLQRGDARRQAPAISCGRRPRRGARGVLLRRLERRIGAALRIARGRVRGVEPRRRARRADAPRLQAPRRVRSSAGSPASAAPRRPARPGEPRSIATRPALLGLGEPRLEIGEPAHRLLGGADARREIGERARIERRRLRPVGELAHLRFQQREPRRERAVTSSRGLSAPAARATQQAPPASRPRRPRRRATSRQFSRSATVARSADNPLVHGCDGRAARAASGSARRRFAAAVRAGSAAGSGGRGGRGASAAFPEEDQRVRCGFTGSDAISVAFRSMVGGRRRRRLSGGPRLSSAIRASRRPRPTHCLGILPQRRSRQL